MIAVTLIHLAFWAWQIYDAYSNAEEYNMLLQRTGRPVW